MDSGIGIGGLSTCKEECVTSSFDLFTPVEVENSIQRGYNLTYRPIAATSGAGPFSFVIPEDPEKFTDAESIHLHGAVRICKKDPNGASINLATNEKVSTINNIFYSLWEKINAKLNGVDIYDPGAKWYAFKAYLENHLSYSTSSRDITFPSVIARDSQNIGFK